MNRGLEEARKQARIDLAAAYRMADLQGFSEGICNHFTLMVPETSDRFYLIPHGLHWSEVTASSLLAVTFDGRVVEGSGVAEPTAFHIHAPLHHARAEARCVLHTHMPHATALNMIRGGRLEPALQTALHFHGRIAYDRRYTGVALESSEGRRLARTLGRKSVLFMQHHGVIVVGPSVADAYHDLYYLERACKAQIIAMSTGRKLARVPERIARKVASQMESEQVFARAHFDALKRILDRTSPEYAS